ncbi:hypothetical protein [Mobilicoccus pelagius]|uniref:Uncharacterized protein n=1 Tax=Mobilicoccus pelagius NBRC 104925 TaxID=1089455 RepID=H5UTQ9_9MICO|nr:hypothetical protein [Mobilicoccus pelagius]GAB49117.1 hypothetical protein MOPEL_096_01250 [Mobilicoccus pelagius NBRC 104925]
MEPEDREVRGAEDDDEEPHRCTCPGLEGTRRGRRPGDGDGRHEREHRRDDHAEVDDEEGGTHRAAGRPEAEEGRHEPR